MNLTVGFLALRVLIALALYALVGVIFWYQYKDLKVALRQHSSVPRAYLKLDEGEGVPANFALSTLNLVGRAVDNSLVLSDSTVSTYHARISFQGGQWWVEDLGSRNGTSVNDLDVSEPLVVTYGDKLRFGRIWMILEAGFPEPESL